MGIARRYIGPPSGLESVEAFVPLPPPDRFARTRRSPDAPRGRPAHAPPRRSPVAGHRGHPNLALAADDVAPAPSEPSGEDSMDFAVDRGWVAAQLRSQADLEEMSVERSSGSR